jgi:membrane fusion protein, multidrug efflux system
MLKRSSLALLLFAFALSTISLNVYAKKAKETPPVVVDMAPVQSKLWQTQIEAIGTLNANQSVGLTSEVDGRVTGIYFRSGDYVKAGTPLVQLNPDLLKAQLAAAQAKEILSAANYQRAAELFKKRVFAQQDLDTSLSAYRADQANVANIQAQLNQTLIRAPFTGRLGLRLVDLGDYVKAGDKIANLNAIDPLRVDFRIPEVYLSQMKSGQTILIKSTAFPNQTFSGQTYAMDSEIDVNTRSLGVRAVVPNKDQKLLPGAFVDVTVQAGMPQKLITVPETTVNLDAGGPYVYRVVDQKAVKTPVTLGQRRDAEVAVLTGLKAGDVVVTVGGFKVTDGASVVAEK